MEPYHFVAFLAAVAALLVLGFVLIDRMFTSPTTLFHTISEPF